MIPQVQPDLEALDTSLDDEEEGVFEEVEKKSVEQLGRLHFKLEYDFPKSEVIPYLSTQVNAPNRDRKVTSS